MDCYCKTGKLKNNLVKLELYQRTRGINIQKFFLTLLQARRSDWRLEMGEGGRGQSKGVNGLSGRGAELDTQYYKTEYKIYFST